MKISGWQWGIVAVVVVALAGGGAAVWYGRSGAASPKTATVADGARAIAEVDRAASANGSPGRSKKRTRKIAGIHSVARYNERTFDFKPFSQTTNVPRPFVFHPYR